MVGEHVALDTSVVTALLNDEGRAWGQAENYLWLHVSIIVLGELRFGALKSARSESNLERIAELESRVIVEPLVSRTSFHFGQIKCQLSRIGRPIPDNDIWIAASAIEHGLPLATRDKHFLHVDGLTVESW